MGGIGTAASTPKATREETLEALEETLITADLSVPIVMELMDLLQAEKRFDEEHLSGIIRAFIYEILKDVEAPLDVKADNLKPYVVMVIGVNGVGKTTTIGKLARHFRDRQSSVLLAAGDTFRAAAIEQLTLWGERTKCEVVKHSDGSDPGAVAFDAVRSAKARGTDVVIIDTAGRLHTKVNLMEELKKISRVVGKEMDGAPHEKLLVLDGSTGQNAISQAKLFNEAIGITGLVVTKLDGTAKGGIMVPIARELKIPVRFIGVGEGERDLEPFFARDFADALI
jgi:fused signal recognition particle receptor